MSIDLFDHGLLALTGEKALRSKAPRPPPRSFTPEHFLRFERHVHSTQYFNNNSLLPTLLQLSGSHKDNVFLAIKENSPVTL